MRIGDATRHEIADRLAAGGIGLRLGPYEFRVESRMGQIVEAVHTLHAHHPLRPPADFSDFRIRLETGWSRAKRSVVASVNDQVWHIWPRRLTVAAMEWVCSWCYFRGGHQALALHAAVAKLPATNLAVVFPGDSGSGKSTLASTLMLSGWDLLSDEIALFDLERLTITALARPTILKGLSIEMIAERFPDQAVFGPRGRILNPRQPIAHLRPTPTSVQIGGQCYSPAALAFPCRESGHAPTLEPITAGEAFALVTRYGINYRMHGEAGFHAVVRLARNYPAYRLRYDDAAEAEAFLRENAASLLGGPADPDETQADRTEPQRDVIAGSAVRPASRHMQPDDSRPIPEMLSVLMDGLREPDRLESLSLRDWDRLVPLANYTELLPRLAEGIRRCGWWDRIPERLRQRLSHELQVTAFRDTCIRYELRHLQRILAPVCDRLVLLKGAAYLHAGFRWAAGRRTNDVDVLVPTSSISATESALRGGGYDTDEGLSEKDDRYYRRWLHEIPPLKHQHRRIEVDVHFRLLPVADPLSFVVDGEIERSLAIPESCFRILDPTDRVLHVILNLARTGEFRRAIRDLWDLECMIGGATSADKSLTQSHSIGDPVPTRAPESPAFDWNRLIERTESRRLQRPVGDVLLLWSDFLGLALPSIVTARLLSDDPGRHRRRPLFRLMREATNPCVPTARARRTRWARWGMEHYPLPRIATWLDPLTWTKRLEFLRERG